MHKLAAVYLSTASVLLRLDRSAEARILFDKAEVTVTRLVHENDADTVSLGLLARCHSVRAEIASREGDANTRITSAREHLEVLERLVELEPENPRWRAKLLSALHQRVVACRSVDCVEEARVCAERGLAMAEDILDTPLVNAEFLLSYASLLNAAHPDSLRQPDKAIAICRRGVEMTDHQDPFALHQLGRLYEATGQPDQAIETFELILTLLGPDRSPLRDSIQLALDRCRASVAVTDDH